MMYAQSGHAPEKNQVQDTELRHQARAQNGCAHPPVTRQRREPLGGHSWGTKDMVLDTIYT